MTLSLSSIRQKVFGNMNIFNKMKTTGIVWDKMQNLQGALGRINRQKFELGTDTYILIWASRVGLDLLFKLTKFFIY